MGIKESALSVIASLTDSDFIRAVTAAGESRKLQATSIGKYILETYSGTTLAGSAQSVQDAVNGLQGDISTLNTDLINKLKQSLIVGTASGSIASFNNGSDIFPALKCVAKIEPNQDLHGYGYSWVGGGGVNKWDEEWENAIIDGTTGAKTQGGARLATKNYVPIKPSTSYYFCCPGSATSNHIAYYDDNKTYISGSNALHSNSVITTPSGAKYLMFSLSSSYGSTYNDDIALNDPSTVTTYSPYENICPISGWTGVDVDVNGTTIPVSWSGDAGTVYGGTFDVVSGVLTVDRVCIDLGSLSWTYNSTNAFFRADITDVGRYETVNDNFCMSSHYTVASINTSSSAMATANNKTVRGRTETGAASKKFQKVYIKDTDYTDPDLLKVAVSGYQFSYKLETPITYTLMAQQVDILLGDNNISANTGPMDPVEYYADATITIQNLS